MFFNIYRFDRNSHNQTEPIDLAILETTIYARLPLSNYLVILKICMVGPVNLSGVVFPNLVFTKYEMSSIISGKLFE